MKLIETICDAVKGHLSTFTGFLLQDRGSSWRSATRTRVRAQRAPGPALAWKARGTPGPAGPHGPSERRARLEAGEAGPDSGREGRVEDLGLAPIQVLASTALGGHKISVPKSWKWSRLLPSCSFPYFRRAARGIGGEEWSFRAGPSPAPVWMDAVHSAPARVAPRWARRSERSAAAPPESAARAPRRSKTRWRNCAGPSAGREGGSQRGAAGPGGTTGAGTRASTRP